MSAIPNLEIRPDPVKGRALHVSAKVPVGALLTPSPINPCILLPSLSHAQNLCAYCFHPGTHRACTRCRASYYCDAKCQAAHWQASHGRECKALAQTGRGSVVPTPVRAAMQILLREDARRAVEGLEGHLGWRRRQGRAKGTWGDMEMMAMGVSAFAGKGTGAGDVEKAIEALCKVQTNAFQRFDPELGQTGVFLEPTLAMINHSCVPNATIQFVGRYALLRAERDIEAGVEVEIPYTDYNAPLEKRKEELAPYCFKCRCQRCRDDLNVYQACTLLPSTSLKRFSIVPGVDNVKEHPAVTRTQDFKGVLQQAGVTSQAFSKESRTRPSRTERRQYLKDYLRRCKELIEGDLWAVSPMPEILSEISQVYVEEKKYPEALLISCLVATSCDPYRFPSPLHPVRVTELVKIAKLLSNTAPETIAQLNAVVAQGGAKAGIEMRAQEALRDIDQIALSQMLCIMVVQLTDVEHIRNVSAAQAARKLLEDIQRLPGREKERSLIGSWARKPHDEGSQAFFKFAVVDPAHKLAELGKTLLQQDFA